MEYIHNITGELMMGTVGRKEVEKHAQLRTALNEWVKQFMAYADERERAFEIISPGAKTKYETGQLVTLLGVGWAATINGKQYKNGIWLATTENDFETIFDKLAYNWSRALGVVA